MAKTDDAIALNDWQAVGSTAEVTATAPRRTRLLGQDILVTRRADGTPAVCELDAGGGEGRVLPAQDLYGFIWTTLGEPERPPLDMPEFKEDRRRFVDCGTVTVRTSPLRIVENFLDMSHFPYVHTGVLGEEPVTQVNDYKVEIRNDVDEVWATDCSFYQPQAAMSAEGGIETKYMYRVSSPFVTVLYKTCPAEPDAWDLIGIFVQPREEAVCDVHIFMLLIDDETPHADLISFQHMIFMQDRSILENQMPAGLPLDPKDEHAIRADGSSMAYRRWMRKKGLKFGTWRGGEDDASRAA